MARKSIDEYERSLTEDIAEDLNQKLRQEAEKNGIDFSESTQRAIRSCAAELILLNNTSYHSVVSGRMKDIDTSAIADELGIPNEIADKVCQNIKYRQKQKGDIFDLDDESDAEGSSNGKKKVYEKKAKLTEEEKAIFNTAIGKQIIKYILFDVLELSRGEAMQRIWADETNFLKKTGLAKDFERVFNNASIEVKQYCGYQKLNVVFCELFPEWYKRNFAAVSTRQMIYATGKIKSGLKYAANTPDFPETLHQDVNFEEFFSIAEEEIKRCEGKNWTGGDVDDLFVKLFDDYFSQKNTKNDNDVKDTLIFLLNFKKGFSRKNEYPGLFEVIDKRGFEHVADCYFVTRSAEQIIRLGDWYISARGKSGIPRNEDLERTIAFTKRYALELHLIELPKQKEEDKEISENKDDVLED